MTLWKKILITVALVLGGSGVVLYLAARFIVLSGYLRLEDAYMQENAQRAANILEDRFRRMGITLDDWGYWDDTCDFVQNATPQYLEDNLEASSITALELNLMIFVDASDQIVSSSMVDLETDEEILMPEALQTYLSEEFFSAYHAVTGTFQTILLLPEAPFLLAAHSILPTSLEGPACGTIVVGRYLDPELVDYLAELAQVDLTIYLADAPQVPVEVRSALTLDAPILARVLDAQTLAGYALVADANGAPTLILETTAPRDIYRQGQLSLWYFLLSIVVAGIGAGASALLFLRRSVLGRIFNLGAEVEAIGASGDPSRRVAVSGNDELTRLERSVNGMLGALEHAQAEQQRAETELREYSEKLKTMVDERTAQLQYQYARLDAILSNTTDGIIVAAADGAILEMNPVAQTWLTKTLKPEEAERLRNAVRHMTQQPAAQSAVVLELGELDLELNCAHLANLQPIEEPPSHLRLAEPPPASPAVVIAIHDVSYLKAVARMQASFVSNVSHELRTPVTALKLYVDLLRRRPAEIERYLGALEQTIDRQMRLVESILNLSRIDADQLQLQRTTTDLNSLVKHSLTASIVQLAEAQNVSLSYQFAGQALPIAVDADRIGQAIYDLVINALHYTLPGGAAVISTGSEMRDDCLWVWLSVADTGIGISEDELPHIFERFYRGARAQQMRASGSGLGLALVQEFIALHGGEVTVASQVGAGSTFTLWLPAAPSA